MQSRFEERLNEIISAEGSVDSALDDIESERPPLPVRIEYDEVASSLSGKEGDIPDKVDDYLFSRKILYGLIDRGTVALEGAMIIARESEHPRAYEVTANIMKSVSEMAKDLLKLHEATSGGSSGQSTPTVIKQTNIQNNFNSSGTEAKDINSMLDALELDD